MSTVTATKTRTYDMAYIAIFAVLIAICSWISIPMTVPFTLQTFGVFTESVLDIPAQLQNGCLTSWTWLPCIQTQ